MKSKWKYGPYYKLGNLEARDPEGHNNNLDDKGAAEKPYSRVTENSYTDGFEDMALPVQRVNGPPFNPPAKVGDLPQARAISDAVLDGGDSNVPSSFGVNEWFDFFGQALTHDVAEAATAPDPFGPLFIDGLPFPFGRTPGVLDSEGVRQQTNEETAFLDLSFVYGNSHTSLDLLRADLPGGGQSAKLLLGDNDLLPTIQQAADDAGVTAADVRAAFVPPGFAGVPAAGYEDLYFAGDNRANQQGPLIALHTIWAREHNYQVDKLTPYANKYGWTQDELFEAARAITEAEWQHIIYEEYLPKLLGKHALSDYEGYKSNVDPSIINEWTTVAFRFGHDQSSNSFALLNEDGSKVEVDDPNTADPFSVLLSTAFNLAGAAVNVAGAAHSTEDIDAWIRGLTSQFAQEVDGKVVDGNRNLLFGGIGPPPSTVDLEAFDIQRGRDHGVWNYNVLRDGLGLDTYGTWEEFKDANHLDQSVIDALISVYGADDATHGIKNLDSIVGGLLEKKYYDSQLGETFTILNVMQFENLRDGDKFYYENRFEHDYKLLAEIENTSFADILARNTDIDYLYRDAFDAHTRVSDTDGSIHGSEYAKDLAIGTDWGESIKTYGGADDVYAGKGNDYIFAGKGNDWIWTGKGRDVVILDEYSGCDVVKDFETKYDKLDLTAYGIDTWKEVKKAMHNTKDGVVIQLDCDNEVTLVGVKAGQLSSKNFIYDDDYGYPVV